MTATRQRLAHFAEGLALTARVAEVISLQGSLEKISDAIACIDDVLDCARIELQVLEDELRELEASVFGGLK